MAGFCVGISEKRIYFQKNINKNDYIIGINSSGLHSNGYSLINHMLDKRKIKLIDKINETSLGSILIKPTKIYTDILNIKTIKNKGYSKYYRRRSY